jgi:hypothetical protein
MGYELEQQTSELLVAAGFAWNDPRTCHAPRMEH